MVRMKLIYLAQATIPAAAGLIAPEAPGLSDRFLEAAGVTIPGPVLAMGLCFAVAGGFVSMAISPPDDRASKLATLLVSLLIGFLAALVHHALPYIRDVPVQAAMLAAGIGSKKIADALRTLNWQAVRPK